MALYTSESNQSSLMGKGNDQTFFTSHSSSQPVMPIIIIFLITLVVIAAIVYKLSKPVSRLLQKHLGIDLHFQPQTNTSGDTHSEAVSDESKSTPSNPNPTLQPSPTSSTTVSIKSEKMSVGILLLCLFLPFLSPVVALIKGRFLLLLGILVSWALCFLLAFIPVIGWFAILIIDLIIAIQAAKSKSETQVKIAQ